MAVAMLKQTKEPGVINFFILQASLLPRTSISRKIALRWCAIIMGDEENVHSSSATTIQ